MIARILLLTLLVSSAAAQTRPGVLPPKQAKPQVTTRSSPQVIVDLERALAAHEKAHDVAFFRSALADDLLDIGVDGKVVGKDAVLKALADPGLVVGTFAMANVEVRVMVNDVALISYDATTEGSSYKGTPYPRDTRISSVYTRRGEHWQLLLHQATLRAATKP